MIFIGGISQKKEVIPLQQMIECIHCNTYTPLTMIVVYSYFSFFFIPIFKWGKRYFIEKECCHSFCEIEKEIGKEIEKGNCTSIDESLLHFTFNALKTCKNCGYCTEENFSFCPKCGNKL